MYSSYIEIKPLIFIDPSFCQEKKYLKEFKLRIIILRFALGLYIHSRLKERKNKI